MNRKRKEEPAEDLIMGFEDKDDGQTPSNVRAQASPTQIIVDLAWRATGAPRNLAKLGSGSTLALIVTVPGQSWVAPVTLFLRDRDSSLRIIEGKTERKNWAEADREVAGHLGRGSTVVGIAVDPTTQLPPLLRGASDSIVAIEAPTAELIASAIARWTRRSAPTLTATDISGLDLIEIVAALRPRSSPTSCAQRLSRASAARSQIRHSTTPPLLSELAGYAEAKQWCLDLAADMEAVRSGSLNASELPSCILHGPPGCGKTSLIASLAHTTRMNLIVTSVADWFSGKDGHLGDVTRLVNDAFDSALAQAPSILFIDELDALPNRATMDNRSKDFWTSVVTGVLLRCDAVRASKRGVVLIGATNHVEAIDAALLRPGRFDRQIFVGPPDTAGIAAIMRGYLGSDCGDADLMGLAQLMQGATGADVTAVIKAARRNARLAGRPLQDVDLRDAIVPPEQRSPRCLRNIAIHEASHAVIARVFAITVNAAAIMRQGSSEGWTQVEHAVLPTRAMLEQRVVTMLAGRAADIVLGDGADVGAGSDLAAATLQLTTARVSYGLVDGLAVLAPPDRAVELLALDPRLKAAVEEDLARLLAQAIALVEDYRLTILRLAQRLIERRVLNGEEIEAIVAPAIASRRTRGATSDKAIAIAPAG